MRLVGLYALLAVVGVLMLATPIAMHMAKYGGEPIPLLVLVPVSLALMWAVDPARPW